MVNRAGINSKNIMNNVGVFGDSVDKKSIFL